MLSKEPMGLDVTCVESKGEERMVTKMNKNWNYRMIRRLCAYYKERAYAAEAELSEAYEEIRKLRDALSHSHVDDDFGISIDWAQRERMMIARNADNSIGRR